MSFAADWIRRARRRRRERLERLVREASGDPRAPMVVLVHPRHAMTHSLDLADLYPRLRRK